MTINKQYLDNQFREVVKTAPDTLSPLSLLGATPLSKQTTELVSYTIGGSSTVFEGEVKPVTETSQRSYDVVHGKQVISLVATEEAVENDYNGVVSDLSSKAISRLVADMDLVIMNGTDRSTGAMISKFMPHSLVNKASVRNDATGENIVDDGDLITALRAANTSKAGIALTYPAWSDLNYAQLNGSKMYPQVTSSGTFDYFGANSLLVEGLGYDGTNSDEEFIKKNRNLALVGNFSKVHRSIHGYKTKVSDTATVDGVSMYETNQVAFTFEILYSFAVLGDANFVLLRAPIGSI